MIVPYTVPGDKYPVLRCFEPVFPNVYGWFDVPFPNGFGFFAHGRDILTPASYAQPDSAAALGLSTFAANRGVEAQLRKGQLWWFLWCQKVVLFVFEKTKQIESQRDEAQLDEIDEI